MATKKKIVQMIASVKTVYPYYAKETDVEMLVRTWTVLLKDFPDEAVEVAFFKCLQICKMPPTPADVIEQLKNMAESLEDTDEELWSVFTKAIRKVNNELWYVQYPLLGETSADAKKKIEDVWNGLPDRLKSYIGSKGELMRVSRNYTDEDLKFERTRFFKTMPTIKQRTEYAKLALMLNSGPDMLSIEGERKV